MRKFKQIKKRAMAFALCAVMTLTSNVLVFAEGEVVPAAEESTAPIIEEVVSPVVEETEIVNEESSVIVEESDEAAEVAIVEEAVVTEESVEIIEESSAIVEESSVIVEESSVIVEESSVMLEEPVSTTQDPAVAIEQIVAGAEEKTIEASEVATGAVEGAVVTTEDTIEIVMQVLEYEDEDVKIHVEEATVEAIPDGASLKVTPITAADEEYTNVEQQLNEKAEDEEYEIAGFLAYDITFVDKDGNKVEPNGGVKVTMEYKEAILPEVVKETETAGLDVTVMHFEEDVNGEVQEVVDMVAATNIEAEVKTTENAEVEKAEFVTDSFSIYTITWTSTENSEEGEARAIAGTVVTLTGTEINVTDKSIALPNVDDDVLNVSDLKNNIKTVNVDRVSYELSKVVICQGNYSSAGAIEVTTINYYNGNYRANSNENYVITNDENGYSLYFVYLKVGTIATVDSNAANIGIQVFDYSRFNDAQSHEVLRNINNGHSLQFVTNGNELRSPDYNVYTGNGMGPRQGFVKNNLLSSAPVLKDGSESLGYLFEKGYSANYLFKKEGGYYVYRSTDNFAELDTTTGNFTVYSQSKQGFFPFNKYSDDIKIEEAGERKKTNHHFGMYVDFTFMQPKAGKVDGQNMIFEFSGDDDVWVFIDGMLVLDLGGIHQKTGGTIDFATGKVNYDHQDAPDTTIRDMFIKAYQEQGMNKDAATAKADEYFVKNGTTNYVFKDYSQHKLDFYYLERGAYDSNCEIKFNLISIPKDSVTIEKEITNYADGAYSDVEFSFNMYLQNGEKDGTVAAGNNDPQDTLVTDATYVHVAVDGTKTTKTIGSDGIFKLRHKEEAIFSHLDVTTQFYVVETAISQDTYDKVEITGSGVLNESGTSIAEDQTSISSKTLEIGTDSYVLFQNTCAATNMKYLSIEKDFDESGKLEGDPDYTFRVTLGGALYKGKYKIGTTYDEALGSANEFTTDNGIIILKKDQVAVILGNATSENGKTGIPSETSFKVEEINLNLNTYVPPKYTVTGADNIETVNTKNGWASGKININYNAHVKITNALRRAEDSPEINVSKTFSGLSQEQIDNLAETFAITVCSKNITPAVSTTLKVTDNGVEKTTEENGDITYTWTLVNYPAGTYVVGETGEEVYEYENSISINGTTVEADKAAEVTTTAATLKYTSTRKETTCSATTYEVGNINLIVAKLTQSEGYFVWTRQRISVNERLGVVDLINAQDGIHFSPEATLNNCYFYSGDISDTLVFRDGEIKYDGSQYLTFDASKQWSMFATGSYEVVDGDAAEIAFKNVYTALTADLDLKKVSSSNVNLELEGAEFALYKYDESLSDWAVMDEYKQVTVNASTEFIGLEVGKYKLVETKAPAGYFILDEEIYFEVKNATVTLTNEEGSILTGTPEMWTLTEGVLTVENDVLYELPSTGGSGIHLYTIGGTVLMAGAALAIYKNKRKEVL